MRDRLEPYEMIFGESGLAAAYFPRIAAALGTAAAPDRERFLTLGEVGELMSELVPESGTGTAQIGLLTYHAFHYWQSGGHVRGLDDEALRMLLQQDRIGEWRLDLPAPAGYFELPAHLLWVPGTPGQPAEPVDGFFWVAGDPTRNALDLLLVLGMRAGRPGATVIELASGPLPPEGHWGNLSARESGPDFGNVLPGGDHLLGLSTAGEVLKLASRAFWKLASNG